MTKQEIEQAIENGESVWINGIEYKLDKYYFIAECNNGPTLYLMTCGYEEDDWDNYPVEKITNICKTKAEAEHYLHHANITRTEKLPFLTWEEFCEQKFIWFIDKNQNVCCLYYLNVSNKIFINVSGEVKEIGDLTEENFYEAYDECVRLFRGGE